MNRQKIPSVVTSIVIFGSTSAVVGSVGYQLGLGVRMNRRDATLLGLAAVAMYTLVFWMSESVWLSLDINNLRGDIHPMIPFPMAMLLSLVVVFSGAMLARQLNRMYALLINLFGARDTRRIVKGAGVLLGVFLLEFIHELRKPE